MFLVFSGVYTLCVMGSLYGAELPSKIEETKTMTLTVAPDGTRHLEIPAHSSFFAKPTSLGLWEISGDTRTGKVVGALKESGSTSYAFSGTVFLKTGQFLTTQTIEILPDGRMKTKDLISEDSFTFTKEEMLQGTDPSMPPSKIAALCAALSVVSVSAQS